jgi:hypothetical protein
MIYGKAHAGMPIRSSMANVISSFVHIAGSLLRFTHTSRKAMWRKKMTKPRTAAELQAQYIASKNDDKIEFSDFFAEYLQWLEFLVLSMFDKNDMEEAYDAGWNNLRDPRFESWFEEYRKKIGR